MMAKRKSQRGRSYTLLDEMLASPTDPLPVRIQLAQTQAMLGGLAQLETAVSPSKEHWRACADAVNLFETLVTRGPWPLDAKDLSDPEKQWAVIEDKSGLLQQATRELVLAGQRHVKGASLRLSGLGIQAVRAVLEDYTRVLSALPARTMIRCHRLTKKRITEISSGRAQSHDIAIATP